MFDLSIEKLLILAVVALFVLGPERLPTAATFLARTLRQIKNYANDANQKIRSESARNTTRYAHPSMSSAAISRACEPGATPVPLYSTTCATTHSHPTATRAARNRPRTRNQPTRHPGH